MRDMTKHIPGDPFSKIKSYAPTEGYREGFDGINWGSGQNKAHNIALNKRDSILNRIGEGIIPPEMLDSTLSDLKTLESILIKDMGIPKEIMDKMDKTPSMRDQIIQEYLYQYRSLKK